MWPWIVGVAMESGRGKCRGKWVWPCIESECGKWVSGCGKYGGKWVWEV